MRVEPEVDLSPEVLFHSDPEPSPSPHSCGRSDEYLDLTEATGHQLIQYEDLESQQQARVVSGAHLAGRELELELPLGLEGLP